MPIEPHQEEETPKASTPSSTSSRQTPATNTSDTSDSKPNCIVQGWQRFTATIHQSISTFVQALAVVSAQNPKRTIALITFVSFFLAIVGLFTNFNIQTDYEVVYAPYGSQPVKDQQWIDNESGFPATPKPITIILHKHGDNVLGMDQVDILFDALDTVRTTPGYNEICQQNTFRNPEGEPDCQIYGATRFWGHSHEVFQDEIDSDQAAIEVLSAESFPGGTPVYAELTFGHAEREEALNTTELGLLTSVQSLILRVELPDVEGIEDFLVGVLDRLQDLRNRLANNPDSKAEIDFFTMFSYNLEFERAINQDLILVPFVVFIMSGFTCLVFFRKDRVQSRCLLGLCSVAGVGLCLASGFGLMFIIGVPFTSMTQLLPFIVFGVGLDDCFIIMGAYSRMDPQIEPVERVRETMKEVGRSIALTSITTMTAFLLGCLSSIPSVRWVCIYAVPTVALNFIYQCSFFISCLILDERRISTNKKDCCFCYTAESAEKEDKEPEQESASRKSNGDNAPHQKAEKSNGAEVKPSFHERAMSWYAAQLLKPKVKMFVIVVFAAYFGFCVYCTTKLSQRFRTREFVPEDSYVADFIDSWRTYSEQVLGINVYFRGVNQSDPVIQQQMRDYMNDLSKMEGINGSESPLCWVLDFEGLEDDPRFELFKDLSFEEKMTLALTNPSIREGYGNDIVQDENGTIVASRCWLNPRYLDLDSVSDQIDMLEQQRDISLAQPVNRDSADQLKFFTFEDMYYLWSFYAVAVHELINTTISGIVAVCVVGFVLIEHRSATAFVLPMILILYVDLLGTLQFAGLYINVVSYVILVISIGLLVDFLMHVILRFYETKAPTRDEKVKMTLETMGASIFVGGFSTFLGVIPLAFSTSAILRTVFTAFFAMVTLGLTHGLILLPVVLSLVGPVVWIPPVDGTSGTIEFDNMPQSPTPTCGTSDNDAHSIYTEESASPMKPRRLELQIENEIEC